MFCRKCGQQLKENEKKCTECGCEDKEALINQSLIKEKIVDLMNFIKTDLMSFIKANKKSVLIAATIIVIIMGGSITLKNLNNNERVAKKFVESLINGDRKKALEMLVGDYYVTNETISRLSSFKNYETKIKTQTIYEEKNTLITKIIISSDYGMLGIVNMALIKIDGKWYVSEASMGNFN